MSGGADWFQLERCHNPACSVLTSLWQHRSHRGGTSTHLRAPLGHPRSRKLKLSSFPVASQRAAAGLCSQASPRTPVPPPAPGSSAGHLQGKGPILEQHKLQLPSGHLRLLVLQPAHPSPQAAAERKTKPRLIQSSKNHRIK